MKRISADNITRTMPEVAKYKLESNEHPFDQIFSIAHIDKNSTAPTMTAGQPGDISPDPLAPIPEKVRVGVSSKVNFSKLTPKEQRLRFLNQAEEINKLRKKFKKYSSNKGKKEDSMMQTAIDKLKVAKYELEDQKHLVENLIKAINTGKLVPNTLAYNQICTILRTVLSLPCPEAKYTIKLPEGTLAISKVEYEEYMKLPCTPAVLRTLIGKEQLEREDPNELLRALHIQIFTNIFQCKNATPIQH
jgi:hypothetical protein